LTWNDYRDQEDAGTDKDLDLYVQDNQGRVLGSSLLTQVNGDKAAGPGESRNPRERVVLTDLAADPDHYYWIRVRARSKNFTASDRLRVLITASRDAPVRDPKAGTMFGSIDFVDASNSGEIFPPADNPGVITVGDATRSSGTGTVENGRVKPDAILENSTAPFSNGEETAGSSNAAAYFAGVVAVLKAAQPNLATRHLLALARRGDVPDADQVVSGGTSTRSISGSSPLPTLPSSPPPAIQGMPLTENQLRALRYAEQLQRAQQARGQAPGGVWISLGNGRQVQVRLPNFMSPPVNPGYSLSPPTPTQPGRSGSTTPTPVVKRPPPAQTPWRTPSPGYLADLVRSQ
jgi:hypothetical protein